MVIEGERGKAMVGRRLGTQGDANFGGVLVSFIGHYVYIVSN